MSFYFYFLIGVLIMLMIAGSVLLFQFVKNKTHGNEQYEINQKTLEGLKKQNFAVSKIFFITDSHSFNKENLCKKMIVVDNTVQKVCLIDYLSKKYYVMKYDEIINYELYENKIMVTNGAKIGGLGVGLFGAETTGNCKELKLIIRIKNIATPQVVYEILSNYMAGIGVDKTAPLYQQCVSSLQEAISFFEVIKNQSSDNKSLSNT